MSGYVTLTAHCCACGSLVTCNPARVPSLRIDGVREPLCRPCALRWCELHDVDPLDVIHPDAYGACTMLELPG